MTGWLVCRHHIHCVVEDVDLNPPLPLGIFQLPASGRRSLTGCPINLDFGGTDQVNKNELQGSAWTKKYGAIIDSCLRHNRLGPTIRPPRKTYLHCWSEWKQRHKHTSKEMMKFFMWYLFHGSGMVSIVVYQWQHPNTGLLYVAHPLFLIYQICYGGKKYHTTAHTVLYTAEHDNYGCSGFGQSKTSVLFYTKCGTHHLWLLTLMYAQHWMVT